MIEQGISEYTELMQTIYIICININIIYTPPLPDKGIRETILFIILSFTMLLSTSFCAQSKNLILWQVV